MTEKAQTATPLAIVGIGCLFPKAGDLEAYWANLRDGVDAITEVPPSHWDPADYFDPDPASPDKVYAARGGFLGSVEIDPMEMGIAPRDIEATDTTQLLALHVAAAALADAGYGPGGKSFDRERASVVLGVTGALELVIPLGARLGHPIWRRALRDAGVDTETADDVVERISEQYVPWQENSFPGLLGNVAAGRIANRLDLHGTNCVVDAACASSLSALHLAALELESGRADIVLAGGVDTFNDVFMYTCFSKTPALSKNGNARPFDRDADGTILGEGVGIVALKRLDAAQRDGDRVYAVVRGIGSSSDGKGQAIYAPSSEGQARALRRAYALADVEPESIGLVEGHGTGTKVGDAMEIQGLASVFDPDGDAKQPWCALGSVKSMIGHTKAAAGVAGLIKAAMALHHRVLPPTLKVDVPNEVVAPGATPFHINANKRPWIPPSGHPRRAGVSAFGFGGSNFHAVLEEADAVQPAIAWDGRTQVMAFSAASRTELCSQLDAFVMPESWPDIRAASAQSREEFDPTAQCRVTLLVTIDDTDPSKRLKTAAASIQQDTRSRWSLPNGTAFGEGPAAGSVAALFPGQGAQKVDMLRDLACQSRVFQDAMFAVLADAPDVASAVYPPHAFDDAEREAQRASLTATDVAQPALGAVSVAGWRVLESLGVEVDAAVGHSYGELSALCVAGALSEASLGTLSQRRGALMAEGTGDRGSMLAVFATEAELAAEIDRGGWSDLTIANHNGPKQHVLSGPTAAIDRAEAGLKAQGIRARRLSVAAAFHSPLVASARAPFSKALEAEAFSPPRFPVYANTTAKPYGADEADARELLAEQLVSSVQFVRCVQAMLADGVRTFVEVGPGRRLCGLVAEIAGDEAQVVALDASTGRRPAMVDLAITVASLAAWGHSVQLTAWDPQPLRDATPKSRRLTLPVCGANARPQVQPRPPRPQPVPTPREPVMSTHAQQAPVQPAPAPTAPVAPAPSAVSAAPTVVAPAAPTPAVGTADPAALAVALQAAQANLAGLMRLQEQTAELHRRFLEGQQHATHAFGQLVAQQQSLMNGAGPSMLGVAPPMSPVAAMPPIAAMPPMAAMPPVAAAPVPVAVAAVPVVAAPVAAVPVPPTPVIAAVPTTVQPASAVPEATSPTPAAASNVAETLLALVAEKTGYPVEMLELSMGLDADLGIDSIKRVEILSGLRERLPGARVVGPEQLGQLQTLGEIVDYLTEGTAEPVAAAPSASPPEPAAPAVSAIAETLLAVVAEKTGYPTEMLELSMGLDADLGIDSIKRVEILSVLRERLPSAPVIGPEQLGTLGTLGEIVTFLGGDAAQAPAQPAATRSAPTPAPAAAAPVAKLSGASKLDRYEVRWSDGVTLGGRKPEPSGAVIVTGPDALGSRVGQSIAKHGVPVVVQPWGQPLPAKFGGLVIVAPAEPDDAFVRAAFALVRDAATTLRSANGWLAAVSRMGGDFGVTGAEPRQEPRAGSLAGLVKTLAREWPEVVAHALDLPIDPSDAITDAVIDAALAGGPIEIGHAGNLGTLELVAAAPEGAGVQLSADDVVLVTGGARGVTAAVAIEMARNGGPSMVLVGRSAPPAEEPAWLAPLADEAAIKRALIERATGPASPRALSRECAGLLAAREIRATLKTIESLGTTVRYRSVDVRDAAAVTALVQETATEVGPVTALVHGAGVLADKQFVDKTDEDFDRVYGTKVEGAVNLLAALKDAPLRAVAFFSSSTARFGRRGQADYAMANEVLNKLAARLRADRPQVRTVAMGWGPWAGGMVTSALAAMFRDEGVATIGLEAGARLMVDELASAGPTEVVVVGAGSQLEGVKAKTISKTTSAIPEYPTVFERDVAVDDHPFLASHVVGGKAVLPTVMILEWFAHAGLAEHPGLHFAGVDDLRIFRGIRLGRSDRLLVRVEAGPAVKTDGEFVVPVALCSGGNNGHRVVHAQAQVVLSVAAQRAPDASLPVLPAFANSADQVYDGTLFHGADFHGIEAIDGMADEGVVLRARAAPNPREWMTTPVRRRWVADPLAVDSGLQAVIVWTSTHAGAASLPNRLGRFRQFRSFPDKGVRIGVRVTRQGTNAAVAELDWVDEAGALVARLTDCEYTLDAGLQAAFGRNRVE